MYIWDVFFCPQLYRVCKGDQFIMLVNVFFVGWNKICQLYSNYSKKIPIDPPQHTQKDPQLPVCERHHFILVFLGVSGVCSRGLFGIFVELCHKPWKFRIPASQPIRMTHGSCHACGSVDVLAVVHMCRYDKPNQYGGFQEFWLSTQKKDSCSEIGSDLFRYKYTFNNIRMIFVLLSFAFYKSNLISYHSLRVEPPSG